MVVFAFKNLSKKFENFKNRATLLYINEIIFHFTIIENFLTRLRN